MVYTSIVGHYYKGLRHMSNQIHELTLLRFLSEYTTKKREINVKEIKLALDYYEMSVQEYAKEFSNEQAQRDIKVPDFMDDFDYTVETKDPSETTNHQNVSTDLSSQCENTIKARKPRSVWSHTFIKEFKDDIREFMLKKDNVELTKIFHYFELMFGEKLSQDDKLIVDGKEHWKNKLKDNIHNWFVTEEKLFTYNNGIYYKTIVQKSLDM